MKPAGPQAFKENESGGGDGRQCKTIDDYHMSLTPFEEEQVRLLAAVATTRTRMYSQGRSIVKQPGEDEALVHTMASALDCLARARREQSP